MTEGGEDGVAEETEYEASPGGVVHEVANSLVLSACPCRASARTLRGPSSRFDKVGAVFHPRSRTWILLQGEGGVGGEGRKHVHSVPTSYAELAQR